MTDIDTRASRDKAATELLKALKNKSTVQGQTDAATFVLSQQARLHIPTLLEERHENGREIDRLRTELEETKRQLKIADGLRQEWKEQFFEVAKAERKIKAALSSCWRVVKGQAKARGLSDAEKLQHIDRIARGAAPPSVLRGDQ